METPRPEPIVWPRTAQLGLSAQLSETEGLTFGGSVVGLLIIGALLLEEP